MNDDEINDDGLIVFDGLVEQKNDPEKLKACFCRGCYWPQKDD